MAEEKKITTEDIKVFMEGHDPMERIVNVLYNYSDDFVTIVYRNEKDQKCFTKDKFYPFLWATYNACDKLCGGDRRQVQQLMNYYGIGCKKLRTTNNKGEVQHIFDNGYRFIFYAKKPMSNKMFQSFFSKCGNPVKPKAQKGNEVPQSAEESQQYLTVTPQQQYLISTGRRFFKGYDDYDQILKMTFDLETTGLDVKNDKIIQIGIKFNRPFYGHPKGFEKIFTVVGNTEEERRKSELEAIENFFKVIHTFQPDVITAHNGEDFDWRVIINACTRLGTSIEEVSSKYFNGESVRKEGWATSLKLGGETEQFYRTVVPGIIITDSLHAVRRAQATDSNFLQSNLKYSTQYLGMAKKNRVYTPGGKISKIWADKEHLYAFNDKNGDWYQYDPEAPDMPVYTPDPAFDLAYFQKQYEADTQAINAYYYGEHNEDAKAAYRDFLTEEIQDWHIEYPTEEDDKLSEENEDYFNDYVPTEEEYADWEKEFSYEDWIKEREKDSDIRTAQERYDDYLKSIEEKNAFKKGKVGDKDFIIYHRNYVADGYELTTGKYIVERYLGDDLWECEKVESALDSTDFMLTKILPLSFAKTTTMGTAGQWKALMLAWSYEQDLAIPLAVNTGKFTGGLSRLMCVGLVENVVKLDYNSLYPSILLTWGICDATDLMGSMLQMLEYVLTTREYHKGLKKAANKVVDFYEAIINGGTPLTEEQRVEYDKASNTFKVEDNRQASVKKLGNSFFGSYGSNNGSVFPWKSIKCAEQTTCIGRQCLRLMISHFHNLGYQPIVGDTDGFNFKLPDASKYRYTEEHPYISTGLSRETKKDVAYTGFKGDVAEFNDTYMRDFHYAPNAVNKMGLGIDEVVSSTINFSRKNYADYFPDKPYPQDVKMVGNTIKSKKMPEYIAKFLAKGIRMLLRGEGQKFLEAYYDEVSDIYNGKIPLRDIASKGKIKKTLKEYIADCSTKTKSGTTKSRQAWYELAIKNNLDVNMGETIYYINTGKKKDEGDVTKVKHYFSSINGEVVEVTKTIDKDYKAYKKEKGTAKDILSKNEWLSEYHPEYILKEEVILNCEMVPREIVESPEDMYPSEDLEYNTLKYITMFNNRIKPLLVCFKKSMRDEILITDPDDRKYFTKRECKLCSGEPNNPGDQDTYEQLMTMEDKEIKFWTTYDLIPPFVEECGMGKWEDIKADYFRRLEEARKSGLAEEQQAYEDIISKMTKEEWDDFLDEGSLPSALLKIADVDPETSDIVSKKFNVPLGSLHDFFEQIESVSE